MRCLIKHPSELSGLAGVNAMELLQQVQHFHLTFGCLTVIAEAAGITDMFRAPRRVTVRNGGALTTVIPTKHSLSASPAGVWHLCYAGAGTGVFEEEEDGFDDALAGLDVDEAVAASQQGPQSQRSSHYEGSGGALPPKQCIETLRHGAQETLKLLYGRCLMGCVKVLQGRAIMHFGIMCNEVKTAVLIRSLMQAGLDRHRKH